MTPTLTAVAAVSEDYAIAEGSGLPWDTKPADLRQYQHRVEGHPIVLGRKTYESLITYGNDFIFVSPAAVLTTNTDYETEEDFHTLVHSREEALEWVDNQTDDRVYLLGGGEVYSLLFEDCDELVISHMPVTADEPTATFPEIPTADWDIVSRECFSEFELVRYSQK